MAGQRTTGKIQWHTEEAARNSQSTEDISGYMRKQPTEARPKGMKHLWFAILLLGITTAALTQILPPGQLPAGPPPQPGQLGPAPDPATPIPDNTPHPPPGATPTPVTGDAGTIGITVRYVLVPTTVLDPDGHGYVNGLSANDFEVFDNDKPQKVTAEYTEQPLSVVLAVQANSEIEPMLSKLKKTGVLLQGLVTGTNGDVAVLAFDHRLQHLQDFTSDPQKLDDAMQKLTAGSNSAALIDAVLESDRMLKRHDPRNVRRRVILLLSRNIDKGSQAHLQETVRDMQFDNVIIYCVDISRFLSSVLKKPDYPRPANGGIPPEALPTIAGSQGPRTQTSQVQEADGNAFNGVPPLLRTIHDLFKRSPAEAFAYFTGGRVYGFATERALETAISDIGADLNSQYLLSYAPNNKDEPGFHTIRVTVDRPGLRIRTRPGYWWGGGVQ
jgi:VWFA-related protein